MRLVVVSSRWRDCVAMDRGGDVKVIATNVKDLLWKGHVPIKISLAVEDQASLDVAEPFFVRVCCMCLMMDGVNNDRADALTWMIIHVALCMGMFMRE